MNKKIKMIGHNNNFLKFIDLYQNNQLPNKILLSGKKGIGKNLFVKHLMNCIFSKEDTYSYNIKEFEINNLNKSNFLYENNTHPNIFKIFKKKDKKFIEIAQIRELLKFQNHSSFNSKNKFIIIDNTDYLNLNSTNALLKSIEEPNHNTFFIIINNSENSILDTLRSRCIEFKLSLNYKDVKSIVNYKFDDDIYNHINKDFINVYNSPSFLISLIIFFKDNDIDFQNISIEYFMYYIIKNKSYINNEFIFDNLGLFIELFFYKHINISKKITFKFKSYFYLKFSMIKKYNLDLESFFIEFEEKLLSE